jgi:hypothetical protein
VRAKSPEVIVDRDIIAEYKWIRPEEVLDHNTIYGMEVHVQNAIIVLRKGMLLDRRLFSVSFYQNHKFSMSHDYLRGLAETSDIDRFLSERSYILKGDGKSN